MILIFKIIVTKENKNGDKKYFTNTIVMKKNIFQNF